MSVPHGRLRLPGNLSVPAKAVGLVIFAHGSGSSRNSPRNRFVARTLQHHNMATFLFDLLTEAEEREELHTGHLRFDIALLADRLVAATQWASQQAIARDLSIAYFGASTGAAAALVATVESGDKIKAVVSRGGRPDLAGEALGRVRSPTLLLVGGNDTEVIGLNEEAQKKVRCECTLTIIPGAGHLFEETGALVKIADLAVEFIEKHLHGDVKTTEPRLGIRVEALKTGRGK